MKEFELNTVCKNCGSTYGSHSASPFRDEKSGTFYPEDSCPLGTTEFEPINNREDEMTQLPWSERINMLSIHPDAATRDDVARMAAELQHIYQHVSNPQVNSLFQHILSTAMRPEE